MRSLFAAVLLMICAVAARADEPCTLKQIAVLPFETDDSAHIFLPATMGGYRTRLMVDTGGWWSLIQEELAQKLKLEVRTSYDIWLVDGVGERLNKYVRVPDLTLGGRKVGASYDFVISKLSGARTIEEMGGTLGLNFFSTMDLEINFAGKTISLFSQDHCRGAGVHWANDWETLTMRKQAGERIPMPMVSAELQGEEIRLLFDTGSTVTYLDLGHAKRLFKIGPGSPGVEPSGVTHLPSGKTVPLYQYTFDVLVISGVRFENVPVFMGDFDDRDLVLGMNEIKRLRLYFAFKDRMIHVTAAE